jgi:fumarate reductase subunit D
VSRRSNQPVLWALFGAGGMLSALVGAALVFLTGIALPLWLAPAGFGYDQVLVFAHHWAGKGFLWVVISLFLWHAAHRIFHTLHDLGIHAKAASVIACYGIAMMGTVAAGSILLRIGF